MRVEFDKDSGRKLITTENYLIKIPASFKELKRACKANLRESRYWRSIRDNVRYSRNRLPVNYCNMFGLLLIMPKPGDVPFADGKLANAIINKANSMDKDTDIPYTVFDLGKYRDRVVFKNYYKG